MPMTRTDAHGTTRDFIRDYPGALDLAYRFGETLAELYGARADEVPPSMKGGYSPWPMKRGDRAYRGRVDIFLPNVESASDLLLTLRHEVLGHYGANTFAPAEKRALLDGLAASRDEPSLKPLWDDVNRRYAGASLDMRAEEVFALHCEGIEPSQHRVADQAQQRGMESFMETCIARVRPMQPGDLQNIVCMVAQGLTDGSRTQQTFPRFNELFRRDESMEPKKPFHEVVAEKLIEQLQQGTAPWQRPWEPGEPGSHIPMNPTTGKRYKGINAIQLMAQGRTDQRWMTYRQATALGAQVRKGEKSTPIQYWKFAEDQVKTDDKGRPVLDARGQPITEQVKLERPRVFVASVFNAEQIDGLPAQLRKEHTWNAIDRAEGILNASGATIRLGENDRAFYRPATDSIHMPDKAQFPAASNYYAIALHELGHWTGHASRLDRDLSHPFGSAGYAKEELRAEIASMILGDELGIGHDAGQHAAYVGSWIKVLQEDPLEIFRAAAAAEKIQDYVLAFEQKQVQEQGQQQSPTGPEAQTEGVVAALEMAGWMRGDGVAIASKPFDTVNGPKDAHAFITKGDGINRTLQFQYVSEGRNVVEAHGTLIPVSATAEQAARLATAAAASAERSIQGSYGVRIAAMLDAEKQQEATMTPPTNDQATYSNQADQLPGSILMLKAEVPKISEADQAVAVALREVRSAHGPAQKAKAEESLHNASMAALGFSIPAAWTGRVDVVGVAARGREVDRDGLRRMREAGRALEQIKHISMHAQTENDFLPFHKMPVANSASLHDAFNIEDRLSVIHAHAIEKGLWREEAFARIAVQRIQDSPDYSYERMMAAEAVRRNAEKLAIASDMAEPVGAARRLFSSGEIDDDTFTAVTRQQLGFDLPASWNGELRIVGVAKQDGRTVDAAQAGLEPEAFQLFARKADAQFGEDAFAFVISTPAESQAKELAESLRLIDALASNPHDRNVKLARLQEERLRGDAKVTEDGISAAKEERKTAAEATIRDALNDVLLPIGLRVDFEASENFPGLDLYRADGSAVLIPHFAGGASPKRFAWTTSAAEIVDWWTDRQQANGQALIAPVATVLNDAGTDYSHFTSYQGDSLESALRAQGISTVRDAVGTDEGKFYDRAIEALSPVFGIEADDDSVSNAYLERKGLAQAFMDAAERLVAEHRSDQRLSAGQLPRDDAHPQPDDDAKAARLARLREEQVLRDPRSTDEDKSAAKEDRTTAEASAIRNEAELQRRAADLAPERHQAAGNEDQARGQDQRVYLNVPFKQKDEAKTLGARWDRQTQAWFVPAGVDAAPFAKWAPAGPTTAAAPRTPADAGADAPQAKKQRLERRYLAVPFGEHQAAKAAGALWDKAAKSWYAGPKANADKLARWVPDHIGNQQSPAMSPRDEFADALRSVGLVVAGEHPVMDGKKHRIAAEGDKKGEQAGFYVGHLDGHPAGYIKNNRTGIEMKWKSKGYSLDPEQKAHLAAEAAGKLQARAAEQEQLHEQAATRVTTQLASLVPVEQPTAYMEAKGIAPQAGAYTDRDGKKTYLPAIDVDGKQWSMQYIQEDGTKRFAKDSRKDGCFHAIGGLAAIAKAPAIVISEGYATAASLTEALGFGAVAAFDSGNLPAVATALHAKFPDKPVIIVGDNDLVIEQRDGINPGRVKAEQAAAAVGGKAMFPIFAPGEQAADPKGFTDFNDLATKSVLGRDGAERQLRAVVGRAIERQQFDEQQQMKLERARSQEQSRAVRL